VCVAVVIGIDIRHDLVLVRLALLQQLIAREGNDTPVRWQNEFLIVVVVNIQHDTPLPGDCEDR